MNGAKGKTKAYQNFIAGKWCDSSNGAIVENRNPAMWSDLIGTFPHSTKEDVDRAVKSAQKAFKNWRLIPPPQKAKLFFRLVEILTERKEQLAFDMTREMGKPIFETRGDVQEAIDTAWYASGEGYRMFGKTVPSEQNNKFAMTVRMPIGVAGLIAPWNFPMAIPSWKIIPALMCGNTVVFKPAELVPLSSHNFIEAILDAGFPPEIINLVHGSGKEVGAHMVTHPDIPLISFTGSSAVGRTIGRDASGMLKRVSMELGGKNAQIIMNDADLDHAVDCAIWGGFGTTGQRCTATSRVICEEGIHDAFVEKYKKAAKKLKIGYGNNADITMGPCVSEGQRQTVLNYVEIGKKDGAELVLGGKALTKGEHADGWFMEPTIFTGVKPNMRIAQEEIFGPVVSVLKAKNFDDAIKISNGIDYGLSSAVFTKNVDQAFRAFRDIEAGITYVNAATIGAEAHMPFGGLKATGNGHREGGWEVYEFYSETKSCYVDYSGKLQRAQIDE
ncbi:MAG: aldehyde dehydrogenase family protein [Calditrichaeota bacterium]|nr:aldehyde dehydrogenase family protein [Calditrichota bacterium]MCB9365633.1 aldehyde dehydrogenase family protein [Calditrichota bacterium]